MIIDARQDVVTLSGCLDRNVWPAIQAPANLLLRQHPSGILIDASAIEMCTPEGVKTFLDAVAYIERYRARIVLCHVPQSVQEVIKAVPGARSQVAIAPDIASGRASLELAQRQRDKRRQKLAAQTEHRQVLVPLLPVMSTTREAIGLAKVLAGALEPFVDEGPWEPVKKPVSSLVHLAFFVEVPRSMPLSAPLAEEEEHARRLLNEAESLAAKAGLNVRSHIIRTRNTAEEIVDQSHKLKVDTVVLSLPPTGEEEDTPVRSIVRHVVNNVRCELMLKRIVDVTDPPTV